ncbi:TlpA family protein disulfide reductase [Arenibacter algicola]|uniref:Thiol-disulfide oxidoreductase ResA n=1 Tax=Arenibacter algicola TaxID=616991 RepID=A0A221UYK5_9FLAO|nr:TlpA disulfide reductase family protein [Arenibacter algicola]ASO06422.1 thiol-disulfide oxidoreductase ResA [Arenibacter algicola]
MKKSIFLAVIILFAYSCKETGVPQYAIIQGTIENPKSDSLTILGKDRTILSSVRLTENNGFADTIQYPVGYYYLSYGNRLAQIYLKPNFQVTLAFDGKSVEEPITFIGKGAEENNYLAEKAMFQKKIQAKTNPGHYLKLEEQPFLILSDSITDLNARFLAKFEGLDENFVFLEKQGIKLASSTRLNVYRNMSKQNPNKNISNDYPDPYGAIEFNDERMLEVPDFIYSAEAYYQDKTLEKWTENKTLDFYTLMLETIDKEVENKNLREELAFNTGHNRMIHSDTRDDFYKKYMAIATNGEYKTKVTEKYQQFKKISKGEVSPDFELYDINNDLVSLADLKGKPVYIDLWATWCMPCIAEIPALKDLEKKFKEIQFVSICKSDTKERWTKMVAEKDLKGIQLFAPNDDIEFIQKYMIQGIPRFILLDTEGKIIDSNAKRPSDARLIEQLESI